MKILHPDGQISSELLEEYLERGMEMRKRVSNQLCLMEPEEFCGVEFAYKNRGENKEIKVKEVPENKGEAIKA